MLLAPPAHVIPTQHGPRIPLRVAVPEPAPAHGALQEHLLHQVLGPSLVTREQVRRPDVSRPARQGPSGERVPSVVSQPPVLSVPLLTLWTAQLVGDHPEGRWPAVPVDLHPGGSLAGALQP